MIKCNDDTQIEVHPTYDFKLDECYRLPEAEMIIIKEEQSLYKSSYENDGGTVISEITTGGNGLVQVKIRTIQHRI